MKAILEFILPDETAEHLQAVHAGEAWAMLHEINQRLRNGVKYGELPLTAEALAEQLREQMSDVLERIP